MSQIELDQDVLGELVACIVEAVQPEKIILFGSWARGEADRDSDIDLFVQVEAGRPTGEASTAAYRAIQPLYGRVTRGVDIVVKDRAFVERYGDLIGTIIRAVLRDGKVIYER